MTTTVDNTATKRPACAAAGASELENGLPAPSPLDEVSPAWLTDPVWDAAAAAAAEELLAAIMDVTKL